MGKKKKLHKVIQPKVLSDATINKIFIIILLTLPLIYFAPLLSGSKMMYGSDWLLAGYQVRKWIAECIKQYGRAPMWDPYAFGGSPLGNTLSFHLLFYLTLAIHVGWTYIFVFAMGLAGLGVYLYLKELRLSIYSSLIGALAYMGCGSVLSMPNPGHDGKILATGIFPFILLFLHKALTRRKLIYFLLTGGISGIAAVNAHFQLIYFAGVMCVFYLVYHLIWQRRENGIKGTTKLLLYSFFGLLLAGGLVAIHYFPIFGTMGWGARGGERSYQFATSWSLPTAELLDLLTPHFSGILDNYWGENYFKLDAQYLGILPLLLALVAVAFNMREKYVRFFVGVCIATTIVALGGHTPLYHIPYWILPGIKKLRAPSMIFYLTSFGITVLTAFGVQLLMTRSRRPEPRNLKALMILLGVIFGVVTIFTIICSAGKESMLSFLKSHFQPILSAQYGPQLTHQKLQNLEKNYPCFLRGLGTAVLLIGLSSILILSIKKLKLILWTIIAIIILIVDQWSIEKKFLKVVPHPEEYYAKDEVVSILEKDKTIYRVFPLHYEHVQDAYLSLHNIQSVGGYISNPGERYQKFIGAGESVLFIPSNLVRYRKLLDILNVKYIISTWIPEDLSQYPADIQKAVENLKISFLGQWGVNWDEAHEGLKLVYKSGRGYGIYKNETSLPRAWIVHEFKVLPREEVISELKNPDFNPQLTVLIEEEPKVVPHLVDTGQRFTPTNKEKVEIKKYTPNKIVCEATLETPGFLVLSENWHPEWRVYINGKRNKLYVANYTLRAVELDSGRHKVEFVYESVYFKLGAIITLFSLLFLGGTVIVWGRLFYRRKG